MRVVLAAVGSRGDVQPMLALAQALVARGHTVRIAAPPNFAAWVGGLGFEFAPLGVDMQLFMRENREVLSGNPLNMVKGIRRYFSEQIPVQFDQLLAACDGAQALLFGGAALTAPSVAEYLRLPILGVAYSTCMLRSPLHPPPMIPWHGLPRWINRLLWRANELLGDRLACGIFNSARARFGLAPIAGVRQHLMEDCPITIAADVALFPAAPDWVGRYDYANFVFFDDPMPLDPELEAWLAEGEAPLYVGFGSMSSSGTDRVGRLLVDAIAATGRRCIVSSGWSEPGSGALPHGWRLVREAPHALLFPRVACVVHHGGSGTTAAALRAGVPQVLLPLILDQFHHAHRLYLAGIAPRPIPMARISAAQLSDSIRTALALPAGPRRVVAERLRASEGRLEIVQRLEALAAAR